MRPPLETAPPTPPTPPSSYPPIPHTPPYLALRLARSAGEKGRRSLGRHHGTTVACSGCQLGAVEVPERVILLDCPLGYWRQWRRGECAAREVMRDVHHVSCHGATPSSLGDVACVVPEVAWG